MHALKWANLTTRMFFAPDAGGGSASPSPSPSGGGGGGDSVTPTPSDGGGAPPPSPSPDPGGTPTPASGAPATPEPTPEPENPWANLGSTDDLNYLEVPPVPPKPEPTPVVPPPTPAATPPVAPVVGQPTPAPASPTPPVPGDAVPPSLSPSDPVSIANAMEANRNDVIAHLAQSKFALTPEDIQELETDVVAAVPKIMSRVFFETQVAMQRFLAQSVPGMMKQYNTVTKANDDAEKQFFDTHKGLDIRNAQHRQTAVRLATLYRQANPNVPLPQLIAEVGPMVIAAIGANAGTVPSAPIPGQPRGGTPFRPAVNGGGGSSPAPAPADEWAGLGQTYDE